MMKERDDSASERSTRSSSERVPKRKRRVEQELRDKSMRGGLSKGTQKSKWEMKNAKTGSSSKTLGPRRGRAEEPREGITMSSSRSSYPTRLG